MHRNWARAGTKLPGRTVLRMLIRFISLPLWLLSAVILGGLSFLNTWDVLIYLFVVAGAFFLARWRDNGWHPRIITQTIITSLFCCCLPIILLYLPFYVGFRSQAGAPYLLPQLMRPTRLVQYLVIFGMPLWVITILLIAQAARQRFRYWKTGLATAVSLILDFCLLTFFFGLIVAVSPEGSGRVIALANELGISLAPRPEGNIALGWGLSAVYRHYACTSCGPRSAYPAVNFIARCQCRPGRHDLARTVRYPGFKRINKLSSTRAIAFVLLLMGTGSLINPWSRIRLSAR